MAALTFTTTAKNAYLDGVVGKTTSFGNYTINYVRAKTAGSTDLLGANGVPISWGTPVQGVASLATATVTPAATGTAALMEWWGSTSYQVASGAVSTTGGGGNLIAATTGFVSSTPVAVAAQLRVPQSSAGTLKINQALANQIAACMLVSTTSPQMANGGTITFYDGTQAATADTAIGAQSVLGTLTLATSDYNNAAAGQSTLAASKTVTPSATGTVAWFRWTKSGYVIDGTVGTTGADIIVDSTAWTNGVNRSMTAATLVWP